VEDWLAIPEGLPEPDPRGVVTVVPDFLCESQDPYRLSDARSSLRTDASW
jgi:hypothetical protein